MILFLIFICIVVLFCFFFFSFLRGNIRPFDQARQVLSELVDQQDVKDEKKPETKMKGTINDILQLCNIIPLEVVGLGKSRKWFNPIRTMLVDCSAISVVPVQAALEKTFIRTSLITSNTCKQHKITLKNQSNFCQYICCLSTLTQELMPLKGNY